MKFRNALISGAAIAAAMLGASMAQAAVWNGAGGSSWTPPSSNYFGPGPQTSGGVTWSSTNASNQGGSVYGYTGGYGFPPNGSWSGVPMEGLNDSTDAYGVTDSMTFSFAHPVSAFGGEINWVPTNAPVTISAYDSANTLLDTLTLAAGGANLQSPDAFYGFIEGSPDIAKFVLTDGYVGIRNVEAIGLAVPEPSTWGMMLLGFLGLGAVVRAHRRADRKLDALRA